MKSIVAISRSARQARNAIAVRGGGGGPLARPEPPSQPLAEQDEMYASYYDPIVYIYT